MKKKILHFDVHKTSLTIAVLYMIFFIPFIIIMMGISLASPEAGAMGLILPVIMLPIYGIITYVMMAFFFWAYNRMAKKNAFGIFYQTDTVE